MTNQATNSDPIDVVMLWVDGSDPAQQASLARFRPRLPWLRPSRSRFRDNGELRYALRSIHRNMPWVRTVHIVTNGQVPDWLDVGHPGINLITHDQFYADPSVLPTFSSSAIEANLHRLGRCGVAERFLLFNDDFFIGQPVAREEYVAADGTPRIHAMAYCLPRLRWRGDRYRRALGFNNLMLRLTLSGRRWAYPPHVPLLVSLSDLGWLHDRFGFWQRMTGRRRFRRITDALARVLYINAIAHRDRDRPDGARLVRLEREHVVPVRDTQEFSLSLARLVDDTPMFFCLNDEIEDDARAMVRAAEMRAALGAIFPDAAPFEKDARRVGPVARAKTIAATAS